MPDEGLNQTPNRRTISALGSIFLTLEFQEKLEKVRNVNDDELKSHDLKQILCVCAQSCLDRKSTRLNSSHSGQSRMPSSA